MSSTWAVETADTDPVTGTADQPHAAWGQAFDAAATLVIAGARDTITLTVDQTSALLAPATSEAGIPATLRVLNDTRQDLIAALEEQT